MNGFLIDTNVLSEYNRPGNPNVGVKRWLETTDRESQYVSVVKFQQRYVKFHRIALPTASRALRFRCASGSSGSP